LEKPYVVSGLAFLIEAVTFLSGCALMLLARGGFGVRRKNIAQVLTGATAVLAIAVMFFSLAPGPRISVTDMDPVVIGILLIALLMPVFLVIMYRRYSRLGAH
jgi:hypothetical protein